MKSLQSYLSSIEDFRVEKKCLHKLSDILFIGLMTYLSNGEDYEDMVLFTGTHEHFLKEFIELPNGIPSHDTFNRVFSLLEPDLLRKWRQSGALYSECMGGGKPSLRWATTGKG
jgi:hypothetical protein